MNTSVLAPPASGPRRKHSAEFKAQAIAACLQPGVSIAAVALANQLNANFLRGWVKAHRDQQRACIQANPGIDRCSESESARPPTLIPVTLQAADAPPSGDIQIEIRRQQTVFQIAWPASQATACAQWLREVLR
jgi:transposase-like protein